MAAQPSGRSLGNCLPPFNLAPLIAGWLADDCPSLDVGGYVVGDVPEEAALLMKSDGVLAGTSFADEVFRQLGCTLEWHFGEGEALAPSASGPGKLRVATARGPARRLLLAERTALNTLARASGVASAARRALAVAKEVGWAGELAGTRKTTPGFRIVEKHALLVGGVSTHRLDLSQMVMLKVRVREREKRRRRRRKKSSTRAPPAPPDASSGTINFCGIRNGYFSEDHFRVEK